MRTEINDDERKVISWLPGYNNNQALVETAYLIGLAEKEICKQPKIFETIFNLGVKMGRKQERERAAREFSYLINKKETA